ncbi:MAG: DMT family transporter [Proteobacteria bacterium]|jgi:drug/metabolite transporter (DMT)-like permease|nr:DMT family transporter [Pseudomonadota bacterium]
MFISAFAFALMSALVKEASLLGIPLLQIIFIRAVISVILSLADIRRVRAHPLGHRRWLLLARGVTGFIALTSVFFAIIHLPIAAATMLHYMHPVFTALLAFIFLMERPTPATLICIALSLTGLGFMVAPLWLSDGSTNLAFWPVMAGLGGALGSGIAYTLVRKLVATEHPSVIVLYFPLVCIPGTLLLGATDFIWPDAMGWSVLVGVGCFTQLGQLTLTKAMQRDSASRATSLSYIQIVFAALLGWLFFAEVPAVATLWGGALILLGAMVSALLQPAGVSAK